MLADSLLPTVFWAEAVNTTCYVLNRVLVTKPHNKTRYELIIGRPSSISFIRPFGCPVTILNTLDPLGKFDGKAEEGFLVGYSVNSKAFRVFNSQTRKVEENLHLLQGIKLTEMQVYKKLMLNSAGESPVQKPASENEQALKNVLDKMMDQEKEASEQSDAQEPTKIAQALDDESWVEAMQEEPLQFKIQKVWTLVDLPYGKKAIGTKWVYRK
ncbi:retrovirus-related pol polyprotein from transposon TNT 1-94 [Tanacetum coccineum]